MLEIKNLSAGVKDKEILNKNNLKINNGELNVIMGTNGTGKSTLVDLIFGLITPDNGTIVVDNKKLKDHEEIFKYNIVFSDKSVFR